MNASASRLRKSLGIFALLAVAGPAAHAEGWCDLVPGGWSVVTHGGKADNVFILGRIQGAPSDIWIQIASPTVGKANVAVALAAQMGGRNISIYLDSATATCETFPSWSPLDAIRHVRLL